MDSDFSQTAGGLSRKDLIARAGAVAAGAGMLGMLSSTAARAASCTDTVQTIIDTAAIAEGLAVTTYYHGIRSRAVFDQLSDQKPYLKGALSEEHQHLKTLVGAGAAVPPEKYHYPAGMFGSAKEFATVVVELERAFISAYGAAVTRFCELNQPTLANLAARILGVEAEHRVLARDILGRPLPNDLCLEPALFRCVSDAAGALGPFLHGGGGFSVVKTRPTVAQIHRAVGKYACR
jgi:Ferritin-like domain